MPPESADVDAMLRGFERAARRDGALLALDVSAEIARARCIVRGAVVDAVDVAHLGEYIAARERFYASCARPPAPTSYWADVQYYQLDHVTVLDAYLRECATELRATERDRPAIRTAVGALLSIAGRTRSIRHFVQRDMYGFAPHDPQLVDVTRRLHAGLLNKLEAVRTCVECALVVSPPPDAV